MHVVVDSCPMVEIEKSVTRLKDMKIQRDIITLTHTTHRIRARITTRWSAAILRVKVNFSPEYSLSGVLQEHLERTAH